MSQPSQLSAFQQHALKLAAQQNSPALLGELRAEGAEAFARATWPGRKTEQWKYTSLQAMQDYQHATWRRNVNSVAGTGFIEIDATRLVFVDGVFDVDASDSLTHELTLFNAAEEAAGKIIQLYLGKIAAAVDAPRRNLFSALNDAWLHDGVLLHVAKGKTLEKPVYIVHVSSSAEQATVANHRILIVLEEGASAQFIEHYVTAPDTGDAFVNALTEIHVGQNANLHHTRLNVEDEAILHIGAVHVNLMRDARFTGFTLAEGSRLKRIDYQMNHCGQGGELKLDGVYLARNQQLVDYHTTIEHRVPNCTSEEVFRGIIGDKAKAVFNGRIHIHPDAQKTLAELSNRNLLTSNTAEIDTKPELEIYADDVRCAHGATISQLDETALYYLQSRGISPGQARVMLSFGFINELLEKLPHDAVRAALEIQLRSLFEESRSLVSDVPATEVRA
jgi:Fe-S cluster assembly protein SufD